MLNIVIPAAGAGSRFLKEGYKNPKPFIDILGKAMIFHIIDNIEISGAKYIFLFQKEHLKDFGSQFIEEVKKRTFITDFEIIGVDGLTDGAACTVLKTKELINNNDELLVVNSDQLVDKDDIKKGVLFFEREKVNGGIFIFFAQDSKWSYASINSNRKIWRVAEKQPISDYATVGIYYWRKGKDFVSSAETMIQKGDKTNNEFYLVPSFNYMVTEGKQIEPYFVNKMIGLGTPTDLNKFLEEYK